MQKSMHIDKNIYEAHDIKSPFVLGIFSPKIYLPTGLLPHERGYILLHEETHIRRRDHIVKLVAFLILCIHWFNPLAWLAFLLMGADMEMSCDEQVIAILVEYGEGETEEPGGDIAADYSMTLVRVATGRRILSGSPLAFGEGGIKERVKRVLSFKKPSRVIIIAAIAIAVVLSIGFAVSRAAGMPLKNAEPYIAENDEQQTRLYTMRVEYMDNPANFFPDMRLLWGDIVYYEVFMPDAERGKQIGYVREAHNPDYPWRIYEIVGRNRDYLLAVQSENIWRVMTTTPPESPRQLYILEHATDMQRFDRLLSISLYHDGTARLSTSLLSSFMLAHPLFYTFTEDEMLIYSEGGNIIARFDIADGDALVFRSASVPLRADVGARYTPAIRLPSSDYQNEVPNEAYNYVIEADNAIVQYIHVPEIALNEAVPIARLWMGDGIRYEIDVEAEHGSRILTGMRPDTTDTSISGRWFHMSVSPENPRSAAIPQFTTGFFEDSPRLELDGFYYLFVGNNSNDIMTGVTVRISATDSQAVIEPLVISESNTGINEELARLSALFDSPDSVTVHHDINRIYRDDHVFGVCSFKDEQFQNGADSIEYGRIITKAPYRGTIFAPCDNGDHSNVVMLDTFTTIEHRPATHPTVCTRIITRISHCVVCDILIREETFFLEWCYSCQ